MQTLAATQPSDPDSLFSRAKEGDQAAWEDLVAHCYERVRRVVRRNLDRPMRTLYDSTDIANDVFTSLVAECDRFNFATIDELRAYLIDAAKKKVIDTYRRQHCGRRDVTKRRSIESPGDTSATFEPIGRDPTPSQNAVADEARELILSGETGLDQEILRLKAESFSNEEAAHRTGTHLRKVQRLVKKASDSWFARWRG